LPVPVRCVLDAEGELGLGGREKKACASKHLGGERVRALLRFVSFGFVFAAVEEKRSQGDETVFGLVWFGEAALACLFGRTLFSWAATESSRRVGF